MDAIIGALDAHQAMRSQAHNVALQMMDPSPGPDDKLFTADRSLGSYGTKITLAVRLVLIEPPIEQDDLLGLVLIKPA